MNNSKFLEYHLRTAKNNDCENLFTSHDLNDLEYLVENNIREKVYESKRKSIFRKKVKIAKKNRADFILLEKTCELIANNIENRPFN
ncbi:hypothetical protein [Enterococcus casseliflavus]|uniref:hypothetical protein n=1 Tax=Enterococcus casseliflavus TaxID=37734 RepID=UPI0001B6C396|nr:hypothetical protein [Enterococcus casseliflavus]